VNKIIASILDGSANIQGGQVVAAAAPAPTPGLQGGQTVAPPAAAPSGGRYYGYVSPMYTRSAALAYYRVGPSGALAGARRNQQLRTPMGGSAAPAAALAAPTGGAGCGNYRRMGGGAHAVAGGESPQTPMSLEAGAKKKRRSGRSKRRSSRRLNPALRAQNQKTMAIYDELLARNPGMDRRKALSQSMKMAANL
jgi:hypothetical protein